MLSAFPTDHALLMQKKWGGGVAPLGQSIKSGHPLGGDRVRTSGRRAFSSNLESPGPPRIPPGPSAVRT